MTVGIDTNVLVRILVNDDAEQAELAIDYIRNNKNLPIIINIITLCELVWVLESSYKYKKGEIVRAIEKILQTKQFKITHKDIIKLSLNLYSSTGIDFSDALIGYLNRDEGCTETITFDKEASKSNLFKLIRK